jgi:hypothetical protein
MNERYCPDCDKMLPASEFYVAGWHKDGSPILRRLCKYHYSQYCIKARHIDHVPVSRRVTKLQSASTKSQRRTAFQRILESIGK